MRDSSAALSTPSLMDLLESAWGIIANSGCGASQDGTVGWHNESTEWQHAAVIWRDTYHDVLNEYCKHPENLTEDEVGLTDNDYRGLMQ